MIGGTPVAPMRQRQRLEFPYKHSTGETIGRFLAGLKEQKKIWGQRVAGQGVVVPPVGYSEVDASDGGEWVAVKDTGVVQAVARIDHPIEGLHPSATPFAFVLVKLDGADTALAHFVRDDLDRLQVGARVQAVWAADDERKGHILDIACFRVIESAPKVPASKPSKAAKRAPAPKTATKATKSSKSSKSPKPKGAKSTSRKTKSTKTKSTKTVKPRRSPASKGSQRVKPTKGKKVSTKARVTKKPAAAKKPTKAGVRKPAKRRRAAKAKK